MNSYWFCSVEHWLSLLTKPYTAESPWRFFYQSTKGSTVMRERHYSSPLTSSMPEGRGLLLHSGCHLNHFQCQMFESAAFCTHHVRKMCGAG
ncbi:hypothetical protein DOB74_17340 [Salmonella enterica subsp. enterica serovar Typhimurium]|nr:hypothetical protein [Salmonella enterica subsp. enterica serovar Typhimurium]